MVVFTAVTKDSFEVVDLMVEYREFLEEVKVEQQDYVVVALVAVVEEEALAKSYPARSTDAAATYEALIEAGDVAKVDAVAS